MKPFIQNSERNSSMEFWKEILKDNNLPIFGLFAYITDSGVAQINTHLKDYIGNSRSCRWLLGFDYGRSQPSAVKKLMEIARSEIRIYDGLHVLRSQGFLPRKSYHLKTILTHDEHKRPNKQIVGSGNLSASGLISGIEAGCLIDYSILDGDNEKSVISDLEELWDAAIPVENIIDEYERKYIEQQQPKALLHNVEKGYAKLDIFWIDVGYVTKNRGEDKPGNQFDLPRGSHVHFGLKEVIDPEQNSVLGDINIKTASGEVVQRRLRFGNNFMEKLTLPIPENYGYGSYDGKILTFKVDGDGVELGAFEYEDFLKIYGMRISSSNKMQSGRAYGSILTID